MDALADYFGSISSTHRALILAGGITLFWIWEVAAPAFAFEYRKWSHALVNLTLTFTTIVVNFGLAFILLMAADDTVTREQGVLFMLSGLPLWIRLIVGLLLLDLISAWLPHWVQHRTPLLWRLHIIHHSDTHVDTTSANRHHPGESIVRFAFTVLAVLVTGTPMWMVFLYQAMSVVLSQFNHANIALPLWFDRLLAWVVVSPDMHKVHHHYVLPYTDSNYGNIFSIWDRMFGTYRTLDRSKVVYGVDTHMDPVEHSTIGALFTMPLRAGKQQRDRSARTN